MKKQNEIGIMNNPYVHIKNSTSGITLIALVITIIVLLILAGVSIASVTGNDGILTRAESAVEKTRATEIKEIVDLAVSENFLAKHTDGVTKTKAQVIAELKTAGKITSEEEATLASSDKITIAGIEIDFSNLSSTETITVVSASGIVPEDYGKQVTGYTLDNYNGTWEILYADDSNIYLITTNVVTDPIYNVNHMFRAVTAGTYATGSSLLTTNPTQYPAASKWFRGWLDSEYATAGSTNSNMQATLFMLDSVNVWNGTYRNATYADWAIGGPTYELLAESVNDVQGTTYAPVAKSATGYQYNLISNGLTKDTVWNRNQDYWLASPSSIRDDYFCRVRFDQVGVGFDFYNNNVSEGFRPVVCLNSSVQLEEGTDGTTYAIKN